MAGSVNKVILIGNLGSDPEIKYTNDNKEIALISLATSRTWTDRVSGEKKERTDWHRVVVFIPALASFAKTYLKKGFKVFIEGTLHTRKWMNNGVDKYITEIVLQDYGSALILLNGGVQDVGGSANGTDYYYKNKNHDSSNASNILYHDDFDEEIPC